MNRCVEPASIIVPASYNADVAPIYRGNPFIEALPQFRSAGEIATALRHRPRYCEEWRQLPDFKRLESLPSLKNVYEPLNRDIDLFRRLYAEMLACYSRREVSDPHYFQKVVRQHELEPPEIINGGIGSYASATLPVIGCPGSGKTTSVDAWLDAIPRVIQHSHYNDRPFMTMQVPWVKLNCPSDGSPKTLCAKFYNVIDALLSTNFTKKFDKERMSASKRLINVSRIAELHGVAIIAFDNLEQLSSVRAGGAGTLMNFIYDLTDTLHVVIILMGTYAALPLLTDTLRARRRESELGWKYWEGLRGKDWDRLIKSLWMHQYTKTPTALNEELSQVMYDETLGIPSIVYVLYKLVQERAITTKNGDGKELITPSLIRSVARDELAMLKKPLDAIRNGKQAKDITFLDLSPEILEASRGNRKVATESVAGTAHSNRSSQANNSKSVPKVAVESATEIKEKLVPKPADPNSILEFDQKKHADESIYAALVKAGKIDQDFPG